LQKILSEIAQEKQRSTPTGVKQMVINITAKQVASFVIKMVRPYPASIAVMIIVAFVWAIDLSVRPYILKIILDRATDAPSDQIFDLLLLPAAA
jgi:ATP-binding cassette subfamily B protein